MKKIILPISLSLVLISCGGLEEKNTKQVNKANDKPKPKSMLSEKTMADPMEDKGVGPITQLILTEIDQAMADEGKAIFNEKCVACHKIDVKNIGPALKGVINRRSPEWIMNMILNPDGMIRENAIAKQLFAEYNSVPMTNQNMSEEEARKLLEYFRIVK